MKEAVKYSTMIILQIQLKSSLFFVTTWIISILNRDFFFFKAMVTVWSKKEDYNFFSRFRNISVKQALFSSSENKNNF